MASYLEVLIAQNELFSAELAHAQNQADSLTQLVNVYKAMGGGWVLEAENIAPAAAAGPRSTSRGRPTRRSSTT